VKAHTTEEGHKVGCTGKKQFLTFPQASRSATRLNRRDQGAHVEAYHCRCCGCCGYCHVGEARAHGRMDARRGAKA
jgi:hypothetical protein